MRPKRCRNHRLVRHLLPDRNRCPLKNLLPNRNCRLLMLLLRIWNREISQTTLSISIFRQRLKGKQPQIVSLPVTCFWINRSRFRSVTRKPVCSTSSLELRGSIHCRTGQLWLLTRDQCLRPDDGSGEFRRSVVDETLVLVLGVVGAYGETSGAFGFEGFREHVGI